MHCVMHKCIMVKLRGNEEDRKYLKQRKFYEIMGEIFKSRGEIIIFQKQGGNLLKQAKLGGEISNL